MAPWLHTSFFGDYKHIKDFFDYNFITWKSISSLKKVLDTSSTLAIGNFWTKPTLGLFEILFFNIGPLQPRCMLMILNIFSSIFVDLHEIRDKMLGRNLLYNIHPLWLFRSCNIALCIWNFFCQKTLLKLNLYIKYFLCKSIYVFITCLPLQRVDRTPTLRPINYVHLGLGC